MNRGSNGPVLLGASAAAVLLAIIAWFFFISPMLGDASDADAQRQAQADTNETLQSTLDALKADFERLPELREQIWEVRDQFPPTEDVTGLRLLLDQEYKDYGVVLTGDNFADPVVVAPAVTFGDQFAQVGLDPYLGGLSFSGLVATPFSLTIEGSYAKAFGLLDALQVGEHRYILVSGLSIIAEAENLSADPPVRAGDVSLTVSGYIFTLDHGVSGITVRPEEAPVPGDEPLPSEETEPTPPSSRNFFIPIN